MTPISLAGQWRFALDPDGIGITDTWYNQPLPHTITLPGILQGQGYGDPVTTDSFFIHGLHDKLWFQREAYKDHVQPGDVKVPFIPQPPRHYIGAAWYQTTIMVPQSWAGRRTVLSMERPKWQTQVWLNSQPIGSFDGLCTPHQYDLGVLAPGDYTLTIRVDNGMIYPYRPDSHSISDSGGNSWNGIVGDILLTQTGPAWFHRIDIYPNYKTKSVEANLVIHTTGGTQHCAIEMDNAVVYSGEVSHGQTITITHQYPADTPLWNEYHPALLTLGFGLFQTTGGDCYHQQEVTFGMRNIEAKGNHFLLNGKRIFLRGTNDHGCFPLTGYPATTVEEWLDIYQVCKDWGMNHIRYHSYCPPKAAFIAADRLGLYLHIETGGWNYFAPGNDNEKHLYMETDAILHEYGNHPSFVLFCSGNEPHGNWEPVLKAWVAKYRTIDNRRLYATQCGRTLPIEPEPIDFADYHYTVARGDMRARRQAGWFGKDFDHVFEGLEGPFLAHELGQHCAYPDFNIGDKFTGYLKPRYYEIFKASLAKSGMAHRNKDFTMASGMLQALCYKEEVEANMRTKAFSGFSLLDLHDYTGQCGAFCGLVDAFWEAKPYITPEWFRRFNAPVVPLAWVKTATYQSTDTLTIPLDIACYAETDLADVVVTWSIVPVDPSQVGIDPQPLHPGRITIPTGGNTFVGEISTPLSALKTGAYHLTVSIQDTDISNDWPIWVYEPIQAKAPAFTTTSDFAQGVALLKEGKDVLFIPTPESLSWNCPPISWAPIFWNAQMGPNWSRPLGLWNEVNHPALAQFPTSYGLQWQWNDIVQGTRAMNIGALPNGLQPFIQPIDDWNRNYKLALAFECKMFGGRMVVCSAQLPQLATTSIAADQLLHSIEAYMGSPHFAPTVTLTPEDFSTFLFDTTIMQKLGATATLQGDIPVDIEEILTGDANRFWRSDRGHNYPYTIDITVPTPVEVTGLYIMPRQNHRDMEGAVKHYRIEVSTCGHVWEAITQGELPGSYHLQQIMFPRAVTITKLRLVLEAGFGAKDIIYWPTMHHIGHTYTRGDFIDTFAALSQVAFITTATLDGSATIEYTEGHTASEEIY